MREQRARQRRSLENRHLVFGRDLADAGRDLVGALGHDDRRAHALLVVAQRHREVRRVGDDDVRLRHFLHHAAAGQLLLHAADAALHFGRAVALLRFLADFLAAMRSFLLYCAELQRHIDAGDEPHGAGQHQQGMAGEGRGMRDAPLSSGSVPRPMSSPVLTAQQPGGDRRRPAGIWRRPWPARRRCAVENMRSRPATGLRRVKFGSQRLEAQVPAADGERGEERCHQREPEDRRAGDEGVQHSFATRCRAAAGFIERLFARQRQARLHEVVQLRAHDARPGNAGRRRRSARPPRH